MPIWLFVVAWVAGWWLAYPRRWAPLAGCLLAFAVEAAWLVLS